MAEVRTSTINRRASMGEAGRIVVIGGGFGGVKCARTLRANLPATTEIVLFDRENHLVFQPLLAEVVGASLDPSAIVVPLRQMLRGVTVRAEEIVALDLPGRTLTYRSRDDQTGSIPFDHIVVATGGIANLAILPGMADHAFPLRTIGDAVELRAHVLRQLELADVTTDPARRQALVSIVVVGGGYSGVEVAGELNDLLRGTGRFFPRIGKGEARVTLIHAQDQILPEISPGLRDFAARHMRSRGVELLLNTTVASADAQGVTLSDGRVIRAGTIVCTIGGAPAPLVSRLDVPKVKGRIVTGPDMRIEGQDRAWAIGDCARIVNALTGEVCGPTGQYAERQGRQTALNILRTMRGEATRPFSYKVAGQLCSIGGHAAVAEMMGLRFAGFAAWFVWRGVYLLKLPQWSRRFKVGFDWAWDLLFPRDLALVKADTTERASTAFFEPGEIIFKEGDPGATFYVIRAGEAEIVQGFGGAAERVLAVLGPGSFFGEKALAENRARRKTARARTRLEVLTLGRESLEDLRRLAPPLAEALRQALLRRSDHLWDRVPGAEATLGAVRVRDLMRSTEGLVVRTNDPLRTTIERLSLPDASLATVVDHAGTLQGVVTLADMVKRIPPGSTGATVGDVMTREVIAVRASDTCLAAADTAATHGLRHLAVIDDTPERRPVGIIDIRDLVRLVLLSGDDAPDTPANGAATVQRGSTPG